MTHFIFAMLFLSAATYSFAKGIDGYISKLNAHENERPLYFSFIPKGTYDLKSDNDRIIIVGKNGDEWIFENKEKEPESKKGGNNGMDKR